MFMIQMKCKPKLKFSLINCIDVYFSERCFSGTTGQWTHRGVFAKLAEGGEGFLMGLTNLFNDGLQLGCQLVALCQLRLWALLLLFIPVISNS